MKNDTHVSRATEIADKIINTFAHSWKKRRELAKVQVELKLPTHSLVTVSAFINICKHISVLVLVLVIVPLKW